MTQFICYERCSTCKKAEKWLIEHAVNYEKRPIREQNPTAEELRDWQAKSGLPLKRFFNTSGLKYKELALKDKLPQMYIDEMLGLLSSDGMLVKRPLLIRDKTVLVGFKEEEWRQALAR